MMSLAPSSACIALAEAETSVNKVIHEGDRRGVWTEHSSCVHPRVVWVATGRVGGVFLADSSDHRRREDT
jgi:hypothetical protein